MYRRLILIGFVCLALLGLRETGAQGAEEQCFEQTRACVGGRFLAYWKENGDLPVFGLAIWPSQNELNADTRQTYLTQWFERNRFELHPENQAPYDVLLGRLGADRLRQMGVDWQTLPRESGPKEGCLWFEQTGHNVCNQAGSTGFRAYWETHGLKVAGLDRYQRSLALFGLPLTEPKMERNSSGDTVLTQWFERARFEWHPNNPAPYKVLLGLLGNETHPKTPVTTTVDIKGFRYIPTPIQVVVGSTVTWTQVDSIPHTVTHGLPASPGSAFDSGYLAQGQTFSFTFKEPGEYPYFCIPHPNMRAVVRVVAR